MKLRIPTQLTVVVIAAATLANCQPTPPAPTEDYNCVYRDDGDGGSVIVARDGGAPVDSAVCRAPECTDFPSDGAPPYYVAPNGDRAPNCAV